MTEEKKPGRPLSKVTAQRETRIMALEIGGSTTVSDIEQYHIRSLREVLSRRGVAIRAVTTTKGLKITRVEVPAK